MAYDEKIAERIRDAIGDRPDVSEKLMFGGLSFLVAGKMFCGIVGTDMMVRVGPEKYEHALAQPHARPMDFTGRPMKGYVFVASKGCRTRKAVGVWVALGLGFVATIVAGVGRSGPAR